MIETQRRALLRGGLAAPLLGGMGALGVSGCASIARGATTREIRIEGAPFAMPTIRVPDFGGSPRLPITDFGARPADLASTRAALAAAIAAAHAQGGGRVAVPAGIWPTGAVHLKSGVDLHLEAGAVLLFSPDPADYLPEVPTSWEGIECMNHSPLVYAYGCEDVGLSGPGKLVAQMGTWSEWFKRPRAHLDALVALYHQAAQGVPVAQRRMAGGEAHLRPAFVQFNRCRRVLIDGVQIENSPFWVLHPLLCEDVVIRRVRIRAHGHNNDGVDPEMCQRVLIEDCEFDQGDDAISVKSGRDHDGWRLGVPTRQVVVRRCRVRNGHQLLAVGSELAAGIEDVWVHDCEVDIDASARVNARMMNLLFVKTNERRGGWVRNIVMERVRANELTAGVLGVDTDALYQWRTLTPTLQRRLTPIEGLVLRDIEVGQARHLSRIRGMAELPVRDVRLQRVRVARLADEAVRNENVVGYAQTD